MLKVSGISRWFGRGFLNSLYDLYRRGMLLRQHAGKNLQLAYGARLHNSIVGKNVYIGISSVIKNTKLEDYSYLNANSKIQNCTIGKFCSIGANVKIVLGSHPTSFVSTHPAFYSNNKPFKTFATKMYYSEYQDTFIGNDVWIGDDSLVLGGVVIGDGAIIAARSVVTKNVEPYSIVGGVPAKLIRFRFDKEIRSHLQKSEWWNRDENWLRDNYLLFHNVGEFLKETSK